MVQAMVHNVFNNECDQCNFIARWNENLTRHRELIHKEVKYDGNHCGYKVTQRSNLIQHDKKSMKELCMVVTYVIIKLPGKVL